MWLWDALPGVPSPIFHARHLMITHPPQTSASHRYLSAAHWLKVLAGMRRSKSGNYINQVLPDNERACSMQALPVSGRLPEAAVSAEHSG